ncbi:PREDICTED: uncharacterized protein LOC104811069 isoform X2 [Tarenaya hassleriana]|nr:PREDICTED: uncharacterized protein LOC104811069 isoform X2 [Tarenaya hassleriana]
MFSRVAPVFYGDIRSHDRVPLQFSEFIRICKQHKSMKEGGSGVDMNSGSLDHDSMALGLEHSPLMPEDVLPGQVYLAQVGILNAEKEEKVQLKILRQDVSTPKILGTKSLSSINFWMNAAEARSSTHYDPHHNLLCIVAGRKKVILWPPSASPMLYPMPIYGEASNHSSVALENPNLSKYPRAKHSMEHSQEVTLDCGDALFIPEGWFHQVDSDDLTIAVNFWWQSNIMSNMSEHMDSYYLRRIIRRLIDREMNLILPKPLTEHGSGQSHIGQADKGSSKNSAEGREQQRTLLHELDPYSLQALHELISLVHDHVNVADLSQTVQSTSSSCHEPDSENNNHKILEAELSCLEDDRVAHVLWTLEASRLPDVLLAMARHFPRTLEGLILHMLSPIAAEVLTQKFDEMDQQIGEEDRNKFYREFYSAFDDQFAAMDAILNRKELFAFQAFKNVMDKYLGVNNISSSSRP